MSRLKFGPALRRWPRTPLAPDPENVRLRTRATGNPARPLI
jgi:hypothetical protein